MGFDNRDGHQYYFGQSATEYALALALIGIVCISGLGLFQDSITEAVEALQQQVNGGESGGEVQVFASYDVQAPFAQIGGGNIQGQPVQLGGINIQVPQIGPEDVEVAAGMGGELTQSLAMTLHQIAAELDKDPDVDESVIAMLQDLANKGHEIGSHQQNMSQLVDQFCDTTMTSTCAPSVFGQTDAGTENDPLKQLKEMYESENFCQNGSCVHDFTQQYSALQSMVESGELTLPPGVMEVVAFEAQQIEALGHGTDWMTQADYDSIVTTMEDHLYRDDTDIYADGVEFNRQNNAEITHQDSAVICEQANATDTGVHCSGG